MINNASGIYCLSNAINGDSYIGSAKNLRIRRNLHFTKLDKGKHHNPHLQSASRMYGLDNFEFEVLLYCEPFELLRYEQHFMDYFKPAYNIRPVASSNLGIKYSDESKKKMSVASKGKPKSEEHRQKIAEFNRNRPPLSEEARKKISAYHKGKCHHKAPWTEEQRRKILAKMIGHTTSEETRRKISEANKGRNLGVKPTPETIAKIVAKTTGQKRSPEVCKKLAQTWIGRKHTMESRMKMSESAKKRCERTRLEKLRMENI